LSFRHKPLHTDAPQHPTASNPLRLVIPGASFDSPARSYSVFPIGFHSVLLNSAIVISDRFPSSPSSLAGVVDVGRVEKVAAQRYKAVQQRVRIAFRQT
jgi:hypothetical protein